MAGVIVILVLAYVATFGGFTAWLASERGRDPISWFLLGAVGGLAALIAAGLAPAAGEPGSGRVWHPPDSATRSFGNDVAPSNAVQAAAQLSFVTVAVDSLVDLPDSGEGVGRGRTMDGEVIYFKVYKYQLRPLKKDLRATTPPIRTVQRGDLISPNEVPASILTKDEVSSPTANAASRSRKTRLCDACGHRNVSSARFCGGCGKDLGAGSRTGDEDVGRS